MKRNEINVIVTGAEEAYNNEAEFWCGAELLGVTVLHEGRLHLRIDPRDDGAPAPSATTPTPVPAAAPGDDVSVTGAAAAPAPGTAAPAATHPVPTGEPAGEDDDAVIASDARCEGYRVTCAAGLAVGERGEFGAELLLEEYQGRADDCGLRVKSVIVQDSAERDVRPGRELL